MLRNRAEKFIGVFSTGTLVNFFRPRPRPWPRPWKRLRRQRRRSQPRRRSRPRRRPRRGRRRDTPPKQAARIPRVKKMEFFNVLPIFKKSLFFHRFMNGFGCFQTFMHVFRALWKVLDIEEGTGRAGYQLKILPLCTIGAVLAVDWTSGRSDVDVWTSGRPDIRTSGRPDVQTS